MFDPERDDDSGNRGFYKRLIVVVVVTAGACLGVMPSVLAYSAPGDSTHTCLAIRDGWSGATPCGADARRGLLITLVSLGIYAALIVWFVLAARARRARNGRPERRPKIANLGA